MQSSVYGIWFSINISISIYIWASKGLRYHDSGGQKSYSPRGASWEFLSSFGAPYLRDPVIV